jgi:tape measure domain-containing protein
LASAGSIFVDLLLRDANYVAGLRRSTSATAAATSSWGKNFQGARQEFASVISPVQSLTRAFAGLAGVAASALSVSEVIRYADSYKQIQGRLGLVVSDSSELVQVQEQLLDVAQRTRQPLAGLVNLYSRLNQFIPELERSQYDLLGVTESLASAIAITGETSEAAQGALVQFTQAIGTNFEAAGQELRSLQEQAPRLTTALTRALGDGTKSLQQLRDEGSLTRKAVLSALSGTSEEGKRLQEELSRLPLTVGQAFTRLDNAFLVYIGRNQLIAEGTNTLAEGLTYLSKNLEFVGNVAAAAALVFVARYIPAVVLSAEATLVAAGRILAFNFVLGQLAFGGTAASISMLALRGSLIAVGAAFKLAIPLAAVAVIYEIIDGNDSLIQSEKDLQETIGKVSDELDANFKIHGKLTEEAKKGVRDRITAYMDEVVALEAILKAQLDNKSNFDLIARGVADFTGETILEGVFGKDYQSLDEVIKKQENASKAVKTLNELLERQRKTTGEGGGTPGAGTEKDSAARKKAADELDDLGRKYQSLTPYIDGLDDSTRKYLESQTLLEEALGDGFITFEQYEEALGRIRTEYDEAQEKAEDTFFKMEDFGKRAAENLQDAFADFLFDPFEDGLDGMVVKFADTLRKMVAEAAAAQILGNITGGKGALGGLFSAAVGGLGSFFSSGTNVYGSQPVGPFPPGYAGGFADGGYIPPGGWGWTGEEGAERVFGGRTGVTVMPNGSGGNTVYNIDASGADKGQIRRLEAMILANGNPRVTIQKVANAQKRGQL